MLAFHESLRRYQRKAFLYFVLAGVFVLISANVVVYVIDTRHIIIDTQKTLEDIAIRVAAKIPVTVHEQLKDPVQMAGEQYKSIESSFQAFMTANPLIDDIYTLRPTATPHTMTFVVSGKKTADANGNNFIETSEMKAELGESYDTSSMPQLEEGLQKPSADKSVTVDKWGAWISGYAPLKAVNGASVAVVGIDYSADYLVAQRTEKIKSMLVEDLVILPFLILAALFVSIILTRPLRVLATAMKKVSHGEFEHRLDLKSSGIDEIFIDLFNNMMTMINDRHQATQQKIPKSEAEEQLAHEIKRDLPPEE